LDVQQTVQIVDGSGHSAMSDPVTIYIYVTVVVHNLFGKVFFQRSFLSNILKFLKKRKKMLITVKGRMIEDLNNTLTWKRGQSKEQILTSGNFVQYFFS
jgi:hypothetical protein